jgi:hypothetical protein
MFAGVVPTETSPPGLQASCDGGSDCEAWFCWRELLMLALEGVCPVENRLEEMLDRIERAS